MTDEQFDDLARKALAFEAGPASESAWHRAKPIRWAWLPTVREIMICGCVGAAALTFVGIRIGHGEPSPSETNAVVQAAIPMKSQSLLATISRIDGTSGTNPTIFQQFLRVNHRPNRN